VVFTGSLTDTEVINNINTIIVTFPVVFTGSLTDSVVINNIDTIIVTLPVLFTGSLTDIYNLLLCVSCFMLFCVRLGMGDPLRS
jgi:hypothetical protein